MATVNTRNIYNNVCIYECIYRQYMIRWHASVETTRVWRHFLAYQWSWIGRIPNLLKFVCQKLWIVVVVVQVSEEAEAAAHARCWAPGNIYYKHGHSSEIAHFRDKSQGWELTYIFFIRKYSVYWLTDAFAISRLSLVVREQLHCNIFPYIYIYRTKIKTELILSIVQ